MLDYIRSFLPMLNIEANDFNTGYFFALAVVTLTLLAIFIIRIIFKIIFRKRRCHTISIKSDNGDAFISCSAIMTVIKALEKEFKALTISKVNLFRHRNKPFLEVYLDFDASKGGLPSHADRFKQRVIESLEALFGIKNIKKVHLHLRNIQLSDLDIMKTQKTVVDAPKTAQISIGSMNIPVDKEEKTPTEVKKDPVKTIPVKNKEVPVSVKLEK